MLKIHSTNTMLTVPAKILEDATISLEAKALYFSIWTYDNPKTFSIDMIPLKTCSSLETIQKAYDELITAGYVTIKNNEVNIWLSPQKTKVTIVEDNSIPFDTEVQPPKKKKLNKWEQIEQLIEEYTEDKELRYVLKGYFLARLQPKSSSRFSIAGNIQVYQVKKMLEQLDNLTGNKIEIVKHCKEKEYLKFFDLEKPQSLDGIKSESITQEEMENIRKRWEELESQGIQTKF